MWLSGYRHALPSPEVDLRLTLARLMLLRLAIMHPLISASWYRYTSKIWAGTRTLEKVFFACGCELVAVDRGQESHLVAKITPSRTQERDTARQYHKMRSRLFCTVRQGFFFFSPII